MIVTIIVRVTKGNKSFHQPYIIEGNPDLKNENDCIMNFIFWLNQTLKNYHDLDLEDFTNWPKDKVENKYTCGSMQTQSILNQFLIKPFIVKISDIIQK
jgi:hypothetical protein